MIASIVSEASEEALQATRAATSTRDPEINKTLHSFLKVYKEIRGTPNPTLQPFFTAFLQKKHEGIRTLATDCLIKYKEEES
jgi:hypothetical protein